MTKTRHSSGLLKLAAVAIAVAGGGLAYADEKVNEEELQEVPVEDVDETSADQTPEAAGTETPPVPQGDEEPEDSDELHEITIGEPGDNESATAPMAVEETPHEELQRYFELYRNAMDNKQYAEADTLAKRVVELTIEIFGINSLDSARALTNLGIAQHQNEDYDAAVLNYNAAIDVIERVEDRLNSNLVNPLKGLGAAELASGRPDLAVETFERAVHVTHVNEGPHNREQVEVLESLAETYLSVGEFDEVETITEIIFGLEARDISLDSLEILPVLEKQASWQHRLQLYEKERYTWRKVIDLIEDHRGDDDLSLIAPLMGLGKSYLFIGPVDSSYHHPTSISSGEVYLKRAVRIAEDNPEATWQIKEDTMLALGDFYILSGQSSRARKIYEDVWNLLSADAARLPNRHDDLETLVVLQNINPPRYIGLDGEATNQVPGEEFETGKVVYDYSVSTRGYTTNVVMVEADPAAFEDMQRVVRRDLTSLIYRPRLVDGNTVATDNLTYTHKFFYRLSDLPDENQQADAAASD